MGVAGKSSGMRVTSIEEESEEGCCCCCGAWLELEPDPGAEPGRGPFSGGESERANLVRSIGGVPIGPASEECAERCDTCAEKKVHSNATHCTNATAALKSCKVQPPSMATIHAADSVCVERDAPTRSICHRRGDAQLHAQNRRATTGKWRCCVAKVGQESCIQFAVNASGVVKNNSSVNNTCGNTCRYIEAAEGRSRSTLRESHN